MTNPRYKAIADHLMDTIASGLIATSGALPTEGELCARYEVSRSTIRKALGLLRDEGWIEARQGSGWSVVLSRRGKQFGTFRLQVTSSGTGDAISGTLGHARRRPSLWVAQSLNTDRRHKLLVIERLTEAAGVPIHRSETWFNPALSDGLDPQQAAAESPARMLADLGYEFGPFDQYAEAVLSDQRDMELLGVAERTAVLQVVRTAIGPDGAPLFRSLHRHPGPAVRLDIDLPTTDQSDGLLVGFTAQAADRPPSDNAPVS